MIDLGTLLVHAIGDAARPLRGARDDHDGLLDDLGDARLVLLGSATHGTEDFHRERARITRRLIVERGFTAVAVDADWADAYRVHRYARGASAERTASAALADLGHYPAWMWRNTEVLDFVRWLRTHNEALPQGAPRAGFYGLDPLGIRAAMATLLEILDGVDPEAARRARYRVARFEDLGEDPGAPGYAAGFGLTPSREAEVVARLEERAQVRARQLLRDGLLPEDELLYAELGDRARALSGGDHRALVRGEDSAWNLRGAQLADTLEALLGHLGRLAGTDARVVVWAHNVHVGDARATRLGEQGVHSLGQLVRERHPREAYLVGQTTYGGSVTAASSWSLAPQAMALAAALPGSYEALFHDVGVPRFALGLRDLGEAAGALRDPRLSRSVGAIYQPESERLSHYLECRLPEQFDAILHLDRTRAVEPLDRPPTWEGRGHAAPSRQRPR